MSYQNSLALSSLLFCFGGISLQMVETIAGMMQLLPLLLLMMMSMIVMAVVVSVCPFPYEVDARLV